MELDQYLGLFVDESKENLQRLNESLLKLESSPDDLETLNDIFRVAHTLKGMSKTMGFHVIGDLTHNMESLLDPLRNGSLKVSPDIIDTLFKCLDSLEKLVEKVVEGTYSNDESSSEDLIKKLKSLLDNTPEPVSASNSVKVTTFNEYEKTLINNALEKGFFAKEIIIFVTDDCVLPAARAFMAHKTAEGFGEIIKTEPDIEALEGGNFEKYFRIFIITQSADEDIIIAVKAISEIKEVKVSNVDISGVKKELETVSADSQTPENAETENTENKSEEAPTAQAKTNNALIPQTIRVSADRTSKLMDLVGELVISRTHISLLSSEVGIESLKNATDSMGRITSEIQEIVMKLRMVPIEQVFNRFPRLVRDVSKELKKDVDLRIIGKDTEIDRIVIDEIGDPLVHLIRNSLDHGLETPEDREAAGKPPKGVLELYAFNEGDNVLIRVFDDGKGINPKKIKELAIKKGVIKAEESKNMSDKDALELIFAPGFSTAEVATDISGRGVGMDVVKSKITALGGNVSVDSEIGVGTTITISLPSTMAIVQALLVKVGSEAYATPLNYISEIIEVLPKQIKNIQNKEIFVLRGKALPLVRLNELLDVTDCEEDSDKPLTVVVAKSKDHYFGFIVSELLGQQEIVIKPINKKLCRESYILGATILGDGRVALILNINSFLKSGSQDFQEQLGKV